MESSWGSPFADWFRSRFGGLCPRSAFRQSRRSWQVTHEALEMRVVPTRIDIQFDYTYDTGNFFSDPARKAVLDMAATVYEDRLTDDLAAITPSGGNTWDAILNDPSGTGTQTATNLTIPANVLRIFVGSRTFGSSTLAVGGPGGYSANGDSSWLNTVSARGQAGSLLSPAKDFGPWGGSIAFSTTTNWYFGTSSTVPAGKTDFYSVAIHEMGHVLGIGTIESFTSKVTAQEFTGEATRVYNGGAKVPVTSDSAHWAATVESDGNQAILIPTIPAGERLFVTSVDWGALQDIGWQTGDRMYRAYNIERDFHFFTQNRLEFQSAVAAGWRDENTGQKGFSVTQEVLPSTQLLNRVYNPNKGSHYYTLDTNERDALVNAGWVSEGTVGRLFTTQVPGTTELFRLYNRNSGVHLFTIEASVKNAILASFPGIWEQHASVGFAFYALPVNAAGVPSGSSAFQELNPSVPSSVGSVQRPAYEHLHDDEMESASVAAGDNPASTVAIFNHAGAPALEDPNHAESCASLVAVGSEPFSQWGADSSGISASVDEATVPLARVGPIEPNQGFEEVDDVFRTLVETELSVG